MKRDEGIALASLLHAIDHGKELRARSHPSANFHDFLKYNQSAYLSYNRQRRNKLLTFSMLFLM